MAEIFHWGKNQILPRNWGYFVLYAQISWALPTKKREFSWRKKGRNLEKLSFILIIDQTLLILIIVGIQEVCFYCKTQTSPEFSYVKSENTNSALCVCYECKMKLATNPMPMKPIKHFFIFLLIFIIIY